MTLPETGRNPGLIIDSPGLLPCLGLSQLAAQDSHWWEFEPVRNWEVRVRTGDGLEQWPAPGRAVYLHGLEDVWAGGSGTLPWRAQSARLTLTVLHLTSLPCQVTVSPAPATMVGHAWRRRRVSAAYVCQAMGGTCAMLVSLWKDVGAGPKPGAYPNMLVPKVEGGHWFGPYHE